MRLSWQNTLFQNDIWPLSFKGSGHNNSLIDISGHIVARVTLN